MLPAFSSVSPTDPIALLAGPAAVSSAAPQQVHFIISTVAGAGTSGFTGDGGQAVSAELNKPAGVAVDSQGDLFIADTSNNVIREVRALTGVITTLAGNGTAGFGGDAGLAASAELDQPNGIAVDGQGDLFIADVSNNRIREVNHSTGIVTTVAGGGGLGDGGQATNAQLIEPYDVALDGRGDLFIADSGNNRIREVNLSTGVISTVAGDGTRGFTGDGGLAVSAELGFPAGVAVDSQGNLFIADTGNNVIREVNHTSGNITTLAGGGSSLGDGGQAASANVGQPFGLALDCQGDLFFAEYALNRVREVNLTTGVIATVAGNSGLFQGYSGDGGPAASAELHYPESVALDGQGDLFIADTFNNVIRQVTPTISTASITNVQPSSGSVQGGGSTVITWSSTDFSGGVDILLSTDGGSTFPTTIASNAPNSGVYAWNVPVNIATTTAEIKVEVHSDPSDFATSSGTFTIVQPTTPIISTVAGIPNQSGFRGDGGPAVSALLDIPEKVAVDGQGDLFIADLYNNVIREVNHATGVITTVAGNGIGGYSGDGGQATNAELSLPFGVAVDGKGNLFIDDAQNNRIREVNLSSGVITTVAGNGTLGYSGDGGQATNAELLDPRSVAVDSQGNLFIADGHNVIRDVNRATGVITTVAGGGSAGLGDNGPATTRRAEQPLRCGGGRPGRPVHCGLRQRVDPRGEPRHGRHHHRRRRRRGRTGRRRPGHQCHAAIPRRGGGRRPGQPVHCRHLQ